MKIDNNIQYNNIAELEQEIENLLSKLNYLGGIDGDVYKGLESYCEDLYLARLQYDRARISAKTNKKQKK